MDESDAPLLADGSEATDATEENASEVKPHVIVPKRTIIIEPLLIAFIFFALPSSTASSQYILETIRAQLGVNSTSNHTVCKPHNGTWNETDIDDPDRKLESEAQSQAAYFSLYLNLLQGVPSAIVGIFLGNYSDKAGRKYAILPPCIGLSIKCLSYVLVIALKGSIYYLFIGAVLDGFCGSFTTLLCGCLAYVADITTLEKRTFRITVVEMCMLLPSMVSSIGTGYLIRATGYLPPFIIMFIGVALCVAYAIFFIPETIIKDENAKFFSTHHLKEACFIYFKDNGTGRNVYLLLLLSSLTGPLLVSFSNGIDTLFEMNSPLCWESVTIGIYGSAVIGVTTVGGLIFAYVLRKCFSDSGIILLSGSISILRSLYKSIVKNTVMMFMSLTMYPLAFLFIPTIRSLMSKHVEPTEYGGLFSGIAAIEALCTVFGNIIFNPVYAETNSFWPGAVFVVMGACVLTGVLLFVLFMFVKHRNDKKLKREEIVNSSSVSEGDYDDNLITG